MVGDARASTYVVYVPLDSSIYDELGTLNDLGYLRTYLPEIKPISRVEAARLTLEAESYFERAARPDPLARSQLAALRLQLHEEIGWIEHNAEDDQPTMVQPTQRVEAGYVFSSGPRRQWQTGGNYGIEAQEATPLLPDNDNLPTAQGSNEVLRVEGWGGLGGFVTAYGEGAVAGPFTRSIPGVSRVRPLGSAVVVSLGNVALSFGQEEMAWGVGYFGQLSQSANSQPFPALRLQNIHPSYLPWFLRYLGPVRYQVFFGQLDGDRYFAHPWIDGEILSLKPLPDFEFGLIHTLDFGGRYNTDYSTAGFFARAIAGQGSADNPNGGSNANSRGDVYLRFHFPRFRDMVLYQEILGEDNLAYEIPGIGAVLPFLAVSYQGGFYLPRLTADGKTDLRFEYAILEPNYSVHSTSLYWTYENLLMGDWMGPDASVVDIQLGRWINLRRKLSLTAFYTERAPQWGANTWYPTQTYGSPLSKEHSGGAALDFLQLPSRLGTSGAVIGEVRARAALEYVNSMNFAPGADTLRALVSLTVAFSPGWEPWSW